VSGRPPIPPVSLHRPASFQRRSKVRVGALLRLAVRDDRDHVPDRALHSRLGIRDHVHQVAARASRARFNAGAIARDPLLARRAPERLRQADEVRVRKIDPGVLDSPHLHALPVGVQAMVVVDDHDNLEAPLRERRQLGKVIIKTAIAVVNRPPYGRGPPASLRWPPANRRQGHISGAERHWAYCPCSGTRR